MSDPVNHPPHYTSSKSGVECIDVTEHMSFCIGNAMKYLWRHQEKGNPIQDLKKAVWYIQREIARLESSKKGYCNMDDWINRLPDSDSIRNACQKKD